MGVLMSLAIIVAVIGMLLIILGAIPVTAVYVPRGLPAGIALVIIGVLVYVILVVLVPGVHGGY